MGSLFLPGRDPLGVISNLARTYGDVVHFRLAGEQAFLVSDPSLIRDVLVTQQKNFTKSRGLERARKLLGNGLLTSEGETHRRHRRILQPAFHRDRIAGYASVMVAHADRQRRRWTEGTTVDVAAEMRRLTLAIVGRTLFSADVESQADDVGVALTRVLEAFWLMMLPFADVIEQLPLPALRRSRRARATLDSLIYKMIADRRGPGGDRGDLLSLLMMAEDQEGTTLTDAQVRDEAMTLLLAGHETTANALTWTWYLLGQSLRAETGVHEEIARVLASRLPTIDDVDRLSWIGQVVTESMRLYPPAWMIGRRAIADCAIGEYFVPARSIVLMSPWLVHRDPRYYPNPDRFEPQRWTPELRAALPKFSYFPFGGGPRQCIGESFAWMELVLVMATLAQSWRLRLVPGQTIVPEPLITLRMKHGVKMECQPR
ncbi:MAG: cytochrome P450 [Blastocatellia bacterium]|nr:MAG: cytochrome P450 [Blastocatellia bacterium]